MRQRTPRDSYSGHVAVAHAKISTPCTYHLEQNPHFYLRCPADESAYTPNFWRHPLQDPSGALEHNDTVYVLFDGPSRVFLDTERRPRIFSNVWSLNGTLIFRGSRHVSPSRFLLSDVFSDSSGVLEGEQLVKGSSIGNFWYCEQQLVFHDSGSRSRLNHRYLRPIVTTSSADRSARGIYEDWTALNRLALTYTFTVHEDPLDL